MTQPTHPHLSDEQKAISHGSVKSAISAAIGFEWSPGELQPVNADDLLRIADAIFALATPPAAAEAPAVERVARAIYEQWCTRIGYVPWVNGGNSLKQDDARAIAKQALATQPKADSAEPKAVLSPWVCQQCGLNNAVLRRDATGQNKCLACLVAPSPVNPEDSAIDVSSKEARSQAWFAVVGALNRACPGWMKKGVSAMDSAVDAILAMARASAQVREVSDDDLDNLWLEHRPPGISNEEQYAHARQFAHAILALRPNAQPLTDWQVVTLHAETLMGAHRPRASAVAFARAIEAAHGIAPPTKGEGS